VVFLFRDKSIVSILFLILLGFAVHTHLFITTPQLAINEDSGIFSFLLKQYLHYVPQGLISFIYIAIVLIQAFRLNLFLNELRMYNLSGFTTAMSYVLLTGFFVQWATITPALLANSLVIWLFIQLSKLYNHNSPKSLLFNTGLIVGAAVLCYQPTGILILVVLFALAIVRPFNLSEWLVLLLGILMPVYVVVSLLYLNDSLNLLNTILPKIQINIPVIKTDVWFWISLGTITILLFAGFVIWNQFNSRMIIQIRKNWSVMMVMLFIILPIPFIFKSAGLQSAELCIVPMAAFIANFFLYPKRLLFPNLLFLLAIAVIVHNNWALIKN